MIVTPSSSICVSFTFPQTIHMSLDRSYTGNVSAWQNLAFAFISREDIDKSPNQADSCNKS